MTRTIDHHETEGDIEAPGGENSTLDEDTVFYRDKATLKTDHTLTLPSSNGTYVFTDDKKDSITASMSEIQSFMVGPIFHLPKDAGEEMDKLLEEHGVVLLVTLYDENGDAHFLHYVLEKVK